MNPFPTLTILSFLPIAAAAETPPQPCISPQLATEKLLHADPHNKYLVGPGVYTGTELEKIKKLLLMLAGSNTADGVLSSDLLQVYMPEDDIKQWLPAYAIFFKDSCATNEGDIPKELFLMEEK